MKAKFIFPLLVGLALVATLLAVLPQQGSVEAQDQPTAFFRVAWEQYDPGDGSNTSTFQVLLPQTQSYTVSMWSQWTNPFSIPNIVFPGNVGFFYTFTVNMVPSKIAIHNKRWNDAEDTGNRYYFYSEEMHNSSIAGGSPDCPRRSDPYQGITWEVRFDDPVAGPIVTLENTTPNVYYADVRDYELNAPGGTIVAGMVPIAPWTNTSWQLGVWKGNALIRAYDKPYWDNNPTCGYIQWDLRDFRPVLPTATPTATPEPTATPTTYPTVWAPTATLLPTATPAATQPPAATIPACVGFCPTPTPIKLFLPLVVRAP